MTENKYPIFVYFNIILSQILIFIFSSAQQPLVGQGPLINDHSRSYSDTPHSVGLLWTSDQPGAETYTLQYTTRKRERYPYRWWDSNPKSQQASGGRSTP